MTTKGICIFAQNNNKFNYVEQAYFLAKSIKKFNPTESVCIITNDDVLFGSFLSNDCKNSDIIDPNFVDDEGRKILDNVINESYNNLFGMHDLKDNIILRNISSFNIYIKI